MDSPFGMTTTQDIRDLFAYLGPCNEHASVRGESYLMGMLTAAKNYEMDLVYIINLRTNIQGNFVDHQQFVKGIISIKLWHELDLDVYVSINSV